MTRLARITAVFLILCSNHFLCDAVADVHYVNKACATPTPPYTNWSKAATNIQDVVDYPDTEIGDLILVTNGVYDSGFTFANRLVVDKAVVVQSVEGPQNTFIVGDSAGYRCVYLHAGATLAGFTLTNGVNDSGAGVEALSGGVVSNCIITCNTATNGAGAYGGVLIDCFVFGNNATDYGGGVDGAAVYGGQIFNNTARYGGGIHGGSASDCDIIGNSATDASYGGGGSYNSTVVDCTIANNTAAGSGGGVYGGGVYGGQVVSNTANAGGGVHSASIVSNCVVMFNEATNTGYEGGGGVYEGAVWDCVIASNSAAGYGGGTHDADAYRCRIIGNTATLGGGMMYGAMVNCAIIGNAASESGGGAYSAFPINNCVIAENTAVGSGGGIYGGLVYNTWISGNSAGENGGGVESAAGLYNCTINGNRAGRMAGGVGGGSTLYNSIVYHNWAGGEGDNWTTKDSAGFYNSCTSPDPGNYGDGTSITNDPGLVGVNNPHIVTGSPCIDAGNDIHVSGIADIDGEVRLNGTVDMGCDEYYSTSFTGTLTVAILAPLTNAVKGVDLEFMAFVGGNASRTEWDFDDGVTVSNRAAVEHAWNSSGFRTVTLTAWNDDTSASTSIVVQIVNSFTNYASASGSSPSWPYTSPVNAATEIQDAIDANAYVGGVTIVMDGLYDAGETMFEGNWHRVVVTNKISVISVNGPAVTTIAGAGPIGNSAVRCAYIGKGSALVGFTLSGGYTRGADAPFWSRVGGALLGAGTEAFVSNCIISDSHALSSGGGACGGTIIDSVISGNYAQNNDGGGVYLSDVVNSELLNNHAAGDGGGAFESTLTHCVLRNNTAGDSGGGAYYSRLVDCDIADNNGNYAGGASYCNLYSCTITNNTATTSAGGINSGEAYNCLVAGNSARWFGGVSGGYLYNCTVIGNSASEHSGGIYDSYACNSVVYFNAAPLYPNWRETYFYDSCTTPEPDLTWGDGTSFAGDPSIMSPVNPHLAALSPCRARGNTNYVYAGAETDIDGEPRLNGTTVDIGCDQYWQAGIAGSLSVAVEVSDTNTVVGAGLTFTAFIEGRAEGFVWDFDDSCILSNNTFVSHSWGAAGAYDVVLLASNVDGTASATVTVQVLSGYTNYVSETGGNVWPYTGWEDAAVNMQDAIDANIYVGGITLVTNGTYSSGDIAQNGRNRIVVSKPIIVMSVNGPEYTAIVGQGPIGNNGIRCANLSNGGMLVGFTLTNGFTKSNGNAGEVNGGAAFCQPGAGLSNCLVTCNSANQYGGGVYMGSLYDCVVSSNTAGWDGGGTYASDVYGSWILNNQASSGGGSGQGMVSNCTVSGNQAGSGGGLDHVTAYHSAIASNTATYSGGGVNYGNYYYCTITDNSAQSGGGAEGQNGTWVYNCLIARNYASVQGGGMSFIPLYNCTVVSNSAGSQGGGTYYGSFDNSIVYYNTSPDGENYYGGWGAPSSCTIPDMENPGDITNEPAFVDLVGGDYHLLAGSPCIDAGSNDLVLTDFDLDGNPRISGARVDMGAYELNTGVATPTIEPNGGTFTNSVEVSLSCDTPGADIRYTLDNSDPDIGSTLYSDAFTRSATTTVKARGFKDGTPDSAVATAAFTILHGITASAGAGGGILPNGVIGVPSGTDTNFLITADAHFHVTNVIVDSVAVGPTNTYTFSNVTNGEHTITALFAPDQYTLTIAPSYGSLTPAAGIYTNGYGTMLTNRVSASVQSGTTQYVCTGWTMTGNEPLTGTTTNAVLTLTNNAVLTWTWQTNYYLTLGTTGAGSVDKVNSWNEAGTINTVTATAADDWHHTGWTGDTNNCPTNGTQIDVVMNRPRSVTAVFVLNPHTLQINSLYDNAAPAVGLYTNSHGATLTNRVSAVDTRGTTQYVCTGWAMTGNEPRTGTTTNCVLTLTNDSVLAWQWKTQYQVSAMTVTHGTLTPAAPAWVYQGSNSAVYTATPFTGWSVAKWFVNGTEMQTGGTNFTVTNVTAASRVFVSFNTGPVLQALTNRSARIGQAVSFSVTATDADGPFPTLTAPLKPVAAGFVDNGNGTGTFSWTPSLPGDVGQSNIQFVASDGQFSVTGNMSIAVVSFMVTNPVVGDRLKKDMPVDIAWTGAWPLGTANVELWRGTNMVRILTNGLSATESNMVWQADLSAPLSAGNDYWIKVIDAGTTVDQAGSGLFTIGSGGGLPWLNLLLGQ